MSAARGVGPILRTAPGRRSPLPVSSSAEDSPSGLGRTIGNRVGRDPSGVQIPYPPPDMSFDQDRVLARSREGTGPVADIQPVRPAH